MCAADSNTITVITRFGLNKNRRRSNVHMPLGTGSSGRDVAQESNSSHYVFQLNLNRGENLEGEPGLLSTKQSCRYHGIPFSLYRPTEMR
jgi:hypothetical protein